MTEIQDLMLHVCFGAVIGVFVGELIIGIVSAVKWVKVKIRKRKEKKTTDSKTD